MRKGTDKIRLEYCRQQNTRIKYLRSIPGHSGRSRLLQVSNWKCSPPTRCCSLRRQSLAAATPRLQADELPGGVSCHGKRMTGKRSGRVSFYNKGSHRSCARFVNGRRCGASSDQHLSRELSYFFEPHCSVTHLSPGRGDTTVTRDSRTACRCNAVDGCCSCDRASALSDVSAPHWELDQERAVHNPLWQHVALRRCASK